MIRVTSQKLRETKEQLEQMNNNLKAKAEEFTTSATSLLGKWDGDAKQVKDTNSRLPLLLMLKYRQIQTAILLTCKTALLF